MKKIRLAVIAVLLLIVISLPTVMAEQAERKVVLTVTSSKEKVDVGDTVEVKVSISENSDIAALQFILSYDAEAVELVSDPVADHSELISVINADTSGEVMVSAMANDTGKGIRTGGTLLTASFKVLKPNAIFLISELQEAYDSFDNEISENFETTEATISCAHSYKETTVKTEAGCESTGVQVIVCTVCDEVLEEEEIPATGHTQGEWKIVEEATCTEPGYKEAYCIVCGEKVAEEEIPAIGHTQGEWKIVEEATCTEPGYKEAYCTSCGEKVAEEEIPATGHVPGEWAVVEKATCTEPGYQEAYCTVCGEKVAEEETPAKGHSFGEWVVVVEATAEENGQEERVCAVCGEKEVRSTEKLTPEATPSPEPTKEPEETPSIMPTDAPSATPATGDNNVPTTGESTPIGFLAMVMIAMAAVISVAVWKKKEA
ncbi:MAG: cohesin domain-containing protein [Lachnospiraceae bacterium]|nr:cohesin domain-containing protein [Lachnospiraceae bacterium]